MCCTRLHPSNVQCSYGPHLFMGFTANPVTVAHHFKFLGTFEDTAVNKSNTWFITKTFQENCYNYKHQTIYLPTNDLPTTYRPPTNQLLTTYQSPTDHLLTTYQPGTNRPPTDHLPTTYWVPTHHLLTTYRPLTDHLPTTYWPLTDHLPTTYWPYTDHLPTNHIFTMQLVQYFPRLCVML